MSKQAAVFIAIAIFGVFSPFVAPSFHTQLALLWIMITIALCWDVMGGQMGYNSFGNIVFFGVGMYTTVVLQVGLFYDVGA